MEQEIKKLALLEKIAGIVIVVSAIIFCFMADYISSQAHLGVKFYSLGFSFYLIPLVFIILGFFVYKGQSWAERISIIVFVLIVIFLLYIAVLFIVLIIIPIAAIMLIIIPLVVVLLAKLKLDKVKKIVKKKIVIEKSNFFRNISNFFI